MVLVADAEVCQAEVILSPGAKISTIEPILEKLERASVFVEEPTVIACGVLAGENKLASAPLLLPAATAITIPSLIQLTTASFIPGENPPPNDMFPTALFVE